MKVVVKWLLEDCGGSHHRKKSTTAGLCFSAGSVASVVLAGFCFGSHLERECHKVQRHGLSQNPGGAYSSHVFSGQGLEASPNS